MRSLNLAGFIFIFILFSSPQAALKTDQAASCTTNSSLINLTSTPGSSLTKNGFKIDASGTIHAVFFEESEAGSRRLDLFYIKSIDGGKTYSAPVRISTDESIHEFLAIFGLDLGFGPAGEIYVVWSAVNLSQDKTTAFFSSSKDQGKSFTPPKIISTGITNSDLCNIAVDRNGNILVSFIGSGNRIPAGFYAVRSINGGQDFSLPVLVNSSDQFPGSDCPVVFDSKGAAYAVYHDALATPITVNIAIARDGAHFNETRVLVRDSVHALFPHIAIDKDDNIYVAYHHQEPNDLLVMKSTDGGRSFGQPVSISQGVEPLLFPYLVVDSVGNVNVIMLDSGFSVRDGTFIGNGDVYLSRSTDGGLSFNQPINVSCTSEFSLLASGAADGRGNLFVSWIEKASTGKPDLFVAPLAFEPAAPDFAIFFNPTTVTASPGGTGRLIANIGRALSFSGKVKVTASKQSKIKLSSSSRSTTKADIKFNFEIKKKTLPGVYPLTFTGRDDTGRVRTGTITLIVEEKR
jgi:hypothetical protein